MSGPKRSWVRRIIAGLLVALLLLGGGLAALIVALSKPLPKGEPGPGADELAHAIERAIDKDAWARTGALRWTFAGKFHHLWDRKRSFDRVSWGEVLVLCDLSKQTGVAYQNGQRISGEKERKLVAKAYASWTNDAFWLNPLVKLFDDGVTRSVVTEPGGRKGLLISYNSGGLTPGDSYLWLLSGQAGDAGLRPEAWRMWVSIIPLKGIENAWDGWVQLATGAWVSTRHKFAGLPITLKLDDVAGASTLSELVPGPDPFAPLMGGAAPASP
jgi:hypothetical protein